MKDIGLWGPQDPKAYADMGILGFADVDLDAIAAHDENVGEEFDRSRDVATAALGAGERWRATRPRGSPAAVSAPAAAPRKRLKMKDLERATGVGREAIRYYIREGLLPEPERPERNVAWYDASFVERILLVKRLQSERFLPLSVIKGMVGAGHQLSASESRALGALDGKIVSAGERERPHPPETLARIAKRIGLSVAELREMAALGAIELLVRNGRQCLEGSSVAIAEAWAGIRRAGFSEESGFGTADLAMYVEVVEWLAREELGRFGSRIAAKVDPETARRMAQEGIDRVQRAARPAPRVDPAARAGGGQPGGPERERRGRLRREGVSGRAAARRCDRDRAASSCGTGRARAGRAGKPAVWST